MNNLGFKFTLTRSIIIYIYTILLYGYFIEKDFFPSAYTSNNSIYKYILNIQRFVSFLS